MRKKFKFYEFFAGAGMARIGLGRKWRCLLANDISKVKTDAYSARWGTKHLDTRDIAKLVPKDLPAFADLAWASFPCQDLSQAGLGLGIGKADRKRTRSGALWPFLKLMAKLGTERRAPSVIVLENVTGLLTANGGQDFIAICRSLKNLNYRYGAVVIDAKHFLPQSRPRIFIIAVHFSISIAHNLISEEPQSPWHTAGVIRAKEELPPSLSERWIWWALGNAPALPSSTLSKMIGTSSGESWHSATETKNLLSMMTSAQRKRLRDVKKGGTKKIGSVYLRMRPEDDENVQRAEVSFGDTLGCIRTPRGGGSRPRIIVVHKDSIRTRLLSSREAATLMGLPANYSLPESYNHAFQLIGDGVAVPVVRFLSKKLIEPLAKQAISQRISAKRRKTRQKAVRLAVKKVAA